MNSISKSCTALLLLSFPSQTTLADTAMLGADRDNTLYEDAAGSLSNGAGMHFFAGTTQGALVRRGLIYFDIAGAIPAGSTINSVELTLNMSMTIAGDVDVALHPVLADWGEAGSIAVGGNGGEGGGGTAQDGDATWLHTFSPGSFWTTPGGDFDPAASATETVGFSGKYTWGSTAGMVSDVQSWLDNPATNYGWLLQADEIGVTAKRFDTHENTVGDNRPLLVVDYTVVPEPATLLVASLAMLFCLLPRRR